MLGDHIGKAPGRVVLTAGVVTDRFVDACRRFPPHVIALFMGRAGRCSSHSSETTRLRRCPRRVPSWRLSPVVGPPLSSLNHAAHLKPQDSHSSSPCSMPGANLHSAWPSCYGETHISRFILHPSSITSHIGCCLRFLPPRSCLQHQVFYQPSVHTSLELHVKSPLPSATSRYLQKHVPTSVVTTMLSSKKGAALCPFLSSAQRKHPSE